MSVQSPGTSHTMSCINHFNVFNVLFDTSDTEPSQGANQHCSGENHDKRNGVNSVNNPKFNY